MRQINSDTGRTYETPEGNIYPSVTTVLGRQKQHYIDEWRARIGEKEANKITSRASARGTKLHEQAESYLRNNPVEIDKNQFLMLSLFKGIAPILNKISKIRLLESQLYSHALEMAGTVDCIASYEGVPSVIDFKTTTKMKDKFDIDSYFIQCSIYSFMCEERYGIRIPQIVVIIANEFGKGQVFIEQRRNWMHQIKDLVR